MRDVAGRRVLVMSGDKAPALRNAPPEQLERALLPWEAPEAFLNLHAHYVQAYRPVGPAEAGLVDQLVWIEWRRRRLLLAERAAHMASLEDAVDDSDFDRTARRALAALDCGAPAVSSATAVQTDAAGDEAAARDADEDRAMTLAALAILEQGGPDAFERALAALRDDSRGWWEQDQAVDDPDYAADAGGLRAFIEGELLPELDRVSKAAPLRAQVRLQAWGESLDPHRMGVILALDERLTRQFEKALGMLIKLQGLRAE